MVVYLEIGVSVPELQRALSEVFPGIKVTAFGKLRDFRAAMERGTTKIALAPSPVLRELSLPIGLQGHFEGKPTEPYLLVTPGSVTKLSDVPKWNVGIVDLLGRGQMPAFVAALLDGMAPQGIKLVTKEEDLLPLLHFRVADAILLRSRSLSRLRRGSNMQLSTFQPASAQVGLPGFWFADDTVRQTVGKQSPPMKPSLAAALGVDEWR